MRAAALTPKGKLLADFRVARADTLRLLLSPGRAEPLAAHLSKYAVFQDVRIEDRSREFRLVELFGEFPPALAVATGEVWPPFFETSASLLVPQGDAAAVEAALSGHAARITAEEAESLRIEAGRPEYGRDMDESNLPDEVGMDDAISTAKGCYVGQEIVARLRTYGRVARRLVRWSFSGGLPPAGSVLVRPGEPGKVLGRVTSAVLSPRRGAIGLGYAGRDVSEGETLNVRDDPTMTARAEPVRRTP
jgi:folate-binding protein YgfZ